MILGQELLYGQGFDASLVCEGTVKGKVVSVPAPLADLIYFFYCFLFLGACRRQLSCSMADQFLFLQLQLAMVFRMGRYDMVLSFEEFCGCVCPSQDLELNAIAGNTISVPTVASFAAVLLATGRLKNDRKGQAGARFCLPAVELPSPNVEWIGRPRVTTEPAGEFDSLPYRC